MPTPRARAPRVARREAHRPPPTATPTGPRRVRRGAAGQPAGLRVRPPRRGVVVPRARPPRGGRAPAHLTRRSSPAASKAPAGGSPPAREAGCLTFPTRLMEIVRESTAARSSPWTGRRSASWPGAVGERDQPVARRGDRPAGRPDGAPPPPARGGDLPLYCRGRQDGLGDEERDIRAGDSSSSRRARHTSSTTPARTAGAALLLRPGVLPRRHGPPLACAGRCSSRCSPRRSRRCGAPRPAAQRVNDPVIGVGEQSSRLFADPYFEALGVRHVRYVVGWDALRTPWSRAEVDQWMAAAHAANVDVLLAFNVSRDATRHDVVPTVAQYRRAFLGFRKRYPFVHEFISWNEGNHHSQPTAKRPWLRRSTSRRRSSRARAARSWPADLLDDETVPALGCAPSCATPGSRPRRSGGSTTTSTRTASAPAARARCCAPRAARGSCGSRRPAAWSGAAAACRSTRARRTPRRRRVGVQARRT